MVWRLRVDMSFVGLWLWRTAPPQRRGLVVGVARPNKPEENGGVVLLVVVWCCQRWCGVVTRGVVLLTAGVVSWIGGVVTVVWGRCLAGWCC